MNAPDQNLVDAAVAAMVQKAGVKIQKDDPILLNALVIQTMLREQVELTRQISGEMVNATAEKLDSITKKYAAELGKNVATQKGNSEIFLEAFREVLKNQSAEKHDMPALANALALSLRGRITLFLVIQALLIAALIGLILVN